MTTKTTAAKPRYSLLGILTWVAFSTFDIKIWINIILVSSMCFIIDYSFYAWHVIFSDQLTQKLRVLINEKGSINCEDDLTSDLKSIFQLFKNVTNNQVIHYSLEDDYKKNDKNIHNNTNEIEVSINETKKNMYSIINLVTLL